MSSYGIGLITGFLSVFVIIFLIRVLRKNKQDSIFNQSYDERQNVIRNEAYKKGFMVTVIVGIIYGALEIAGITLCTPGVGSIISIFIGISVFACTAIANDAYYGLNEQKKKMIILFGVVALIQWVSSIMHIIDGDILEEGKLGFAGVSFACAVLFTVITIVSLVHREPAEDED